MEDSVTHFYVLTENGDQFPSEFNHEKLKSIIEESDVFIEVLDSSAERFTCSCSQKHFQRLERAYSFKSVKLLIVKVPPPKPLKLTFRRGDDGAIKCPNPNLVVKKIKEYDDASISPIQCDLGSTEWTFSCPSEHVSKLGDSVIRLLIKGEELIGKLSSDEFHFSVVPDGYEPFPDMLTAEKLIEIISEESDIDIQVDLENSNSSRFECRCDAGKSHLLEDKYSFQSTILLVEMKKNALPPPPLSSQPLSPPPAPVSTPAPLSESFFLQTNALKQIFLARETFEVEKTQQTLVEDNLSVLLHHATHEKLKFSSSDGKLLFLAVQSSRKESGSRSYITPPRGLEELRSVLLNRTEVCELIDSVFGNVDKEGLSSIENDVKKLFALWKRYLEEVRKAEDIFSSAIREFAVNNRGIIYDTISPCLQSSNSDCLATSTWEILNSIAGILDSFPNFTEDRYVLGAFFNIEIQWKKLVTCSFEAYEEISRICSSVLMEIRPVSLPNIVHLLEKLNLRTFEGKDIIPVLGRSGVGKSTFLYFLHGLKFNRRIVEGSNCFHDPIEKDGILATLKAAGIVSSSLDDSATSDIIPIEIKVDGQTFYVLDTPGFGDTRGNVIDLVNGYMIGKAICGANSVRPVLLIMNEVRKSSEEAKAAYRKYTDLVYQPLEKNLSHFNLVVTRMEGNLNLTMEQRQENMAGEFLGLTNSISAGDERARTFCKVLGSKLKNGGAYLLDLDNHTGGDYIRSFVKSVAIADTTKVFTDCISSISRMALKQQFNLAKKSLAHSLNTGDIVIADRRFEEFDRLKDSLLIVDSVDAYEECCAIVREVIGAKMQVIKLLDEKFTLSNTSKVNEIINALLVINLVLKSKLSAKMKFFEENKSFFDSYIRDVCDFFAKMGCELKRQLETNDSQHINLAHEIFSTLTMIRDRARQTLQNLRELDPLFAAIELTIQHAATDVALYMESYVELFRGSALKSCDLLSCLQFVKTGEYALALAVRALPASTPVISNLRSLGDEFRSAVISSCGRCVSVDWSQDLSRYKYSCDQLIRLRDSLRGDYSKFLLNFDLLGSLQGIDEEAMNYVQHVVCEIHKMDSFPPDSDWLLAAYTNLRELSDLSVPSNTFSLDSGGTTIGEQLKVAKNHLLSICEKVSILFRESALLLFTCEDSTELVKKSLTCESNSEILFRSAFIHESFHLQAFSNCNNYFSHILKQISSLKQQNSSRIETENVRWFGLLRFKALALKQSMCQLKPVSSYTEVEDSSMATIIKKYEEVHNSFCQLFREGLDSAKAFFSELRPWTQFVDRSLRSDSSTESKISAYANLHHSHSFFLQECEAFKTTLPLENKQDDSICCQKHVDTAVSQRNETVEKLLKSLYGDIRREIPWMYDQTFPDGVFAMQNIPQMSSMDKVSVMTSYLHHVYRSDSEYDKFVQNLSLLAARFSERLEQETGIDEVTRIHSMSSVLYIFDKWLVHLDHCFGSVLAFAEKKYKSLQSAMLVSINLGDYYKLNQISEGRRTQFDAQQLQQVRSSFNNLLASLDFDVAVPKKNDQNRYRIHNSVWKVLCKYRNGLTYLKNYTECHTAELENALEDNIASFMGQLQHMAESIEEYVTHGHLHLAFPYLSVLDRCVNSFSPIIGAPISGDGHISCLFCSNSRAIEGEIANLADDWECNNCSRFQRLFRSPGQSTRSNDLILDLYKYINSLYTARTNQLREQIASMVPSIVNICKGRSPPDAVDINYEMDAVEMLDSISNAAEETHLLKQFEWIGEMFNVKFQTAVNARFSVYPHALQMLYQEITNVEEQLRKVFEENLKSLIAQFEAVFDKQAKQVKLPDPSKHKEIRRLLDGLHVAFRVLSPAQSRSILKNDSTTRFKDINYDILTMEYLIGRQRKELLELGDLASFEEIISGADTMELEGLFVKFKATVGSAKFLPSTKSLQGSGILEACEAISVQGQHWFIHRHAAAVNVVKKFLKVALSRYVDCCKEYFSFKTNISTKRRSRVTSGVSLDWTPDCLVPVIKCAEILDHLKKWFVAGAPELDVVNSIEDFAKKIIDYFYNRSTELNRLISLIEKYFPSNPADKIGQSIFNAKLIDHQDIIRIGKYAQEISLFKSLIKKVSSAKRALAVDTIIGEKIEEFKTLNDLDDRFQKLQDVSDALVKYLVEHREKLEAKDPTGKVKYYELLYSCYLMAKHVLDDEESHSQVTLQITKDASTFEADIIDLISKILSSHVDKKSCEEIASKIENLKSIQSVCGEFFNHVDPIISNVHRELGKKLFELSKELWLNDQDWLNWKSKFSYVRDQMIQLKLIGICVPSCDASVNQYISEAVEKYQRERSQDPEETCQFFGLLCNGLNVTPGGEAVIDSVKSLQAYKNFLRNTEFAQVNCENVIGLMTSAKGIPLDADAAHRLRELYYIVMDRYYWPVVMDCLDKRHEIKCIPNEVNEIGAALRQCKNAPTSELEIHILRIIAYFFAYWTLNNLDGYDTISSTKEKRKHLFQPHPGQVLVILRLLGLDRPSTFHKQNIFQNIASRAKDFLWSSLFGSIKRDNIPPYTIDSQVAQINTGEGKSVVLAGLACVIVFLGFDVDIVCYSQYLSNRDSEAFQYVFSDFNISDRVNYGTFKSLSTKLLDQSQTLRGLVTGVIEGDTAKVNALRFSTHKMPRHRILLIDELDVLFSKSFYGHGYTILGALEGRRFDCISKLIDFVWENKTLKRPDLWGQVETSDCYRECRKTFPQWEFLIESAAKKMVCDVHEFEEQLLLNPPKRMDADGLWYFDDDNELTNKRRDGYKTVFTYMKKNSTDPSIITNEMILDLKNILINAGTLSFAELPKLYMCTMGVTGTLTTLTAEQKKLLEKEYGLSDSNTVVMPSAYPSPDATQLTNYAGKLDQDIFAGFRGWYFETISSQISNNLKDPRTSKPRPVLVYFKDDQSLKSFFADKSFDPFRAEALLLTTETRSDKVQEIISKAVHPGQVTLIIAAFGRGTDFYYVNKDLDQAKGIHVIQTFFSLDYSEEVQIRGRTNRQGHPGSYCMVLQAEDFEAGGITDINQMPKDIQSVFFATRARKSTEDFQNSVQLADYKLKQHKLSTEVLHLLFSDSPKDRQKLQDVIQEFNAFNVEMVSSTSRTIILMDGTCSMSLLFIKCKTRVKEILRRVGEILVAKNVTSGFEVQFVVYRNYSSLEKDLLVVSEWSRDPQALFEFIDKTEVSGGVGGTEAIEVAFWHVNQQAARPRGKVTQVILIGDQGPSSQTEVMERRAQVKADGLIGEQYWAKTESFKTAVFYKTELDKDHAISKKKIPIHTNYVPTSNGEMPAKTTFEEIARLTGGDCRQLLVGNAKDSEDLVHVIAARILKDIEKNLGGAAINLKLADGYLKRYADSGFVL
jgi:regulator of replication initiation timing